MPGAALRWPALAAALASQLHTGGYPRLRAAAR